MSSWCYFSFSNLECNPGNFGLNCSGHCSGHCENHEACNHVSGMCLNNCQDGYSGEYCNSCKKGIINTKWHVTHYFVVLSECTLLILACQAGTYGKDCTLNCSSNCTAACKHTDRPCIECWNRFCFKGNVCEWFFFVHVNISLLMCIC